MTTDNQQAPVAGTGGDHLDKALLYDLDQAGIEQRHKESVELVELRAQIEALKRERDTLVANERNCWERRQEAAERVVEAEQRADTAEGKLRVSVTATLMERERADRLQAELDAAKVDAERYQWLRDEDNWIDNMDAWQMLGELSFSDFDAFIDAARAKESGDV